MGARASRAASLADVDVVFAALGHEVRRQIVVLLSRLGGELPSGWFAARFSHSWPTTTRHLNVLEGAGIVSVRRTGRSSHYRLNRARIERVVGGWLCHLEPSAPGKTWEPTGPRTTAELGKSPPRNESKRKAR
jgi:DNA-binding transcriptional ArsR family regulator